jgi:glucosamine 6-phosphate synthetase-like amidotransferase/phosphosugar isomerase protein
MLNIRLKQALQDSLLTQYKDVAAFLKDHENLFILAKGTGFMVAHYMSQKFTQVTTIHAEAYPSGEFRHGPLSMIDEKEKTPGKFFNYLRTYIVLFIVLDDEHLV